MRPHGHVDELVHDTYPEPGHSPPEDDELLDDEALLDTLQDSTSRYEVDEGFGVKTSGVHLATF